jgi:thiosulfate/3-mercaptopyruvate sulfurtransferase
MSMEFPAVLVSCNWVQENLSNPKVKLIEVDVDTNAYHEGHIPGAIGFNWTTQTQDQVRRDILNKEQVESLLGSAGIRETDTIVVYGDNNNWFAAYFFWMIKQYGHADIRIMDGGRKKWVADGRPTTAEVPAVTAVQYKARPWIPGFRARIQDVLQAIDALDRSALVDVRSPAEFSGELLAPPGLSETAQRAGHIPGAQNIPWAQVVNEDGTFKSPEQLQKLYEAKGITPDKSVITYCRIGERSSHTWFVLRELLGYPSVINYDGSWTEYGSMIGLPIEKSS